MFSLVSYIYVLKNKFSILCWSSGGTFVLFEVIRIANDVEPVFCFTVADPELHRFYLRITIAYPELVRPTIFLHYFTLKEIFCVRYYRLSELFSVKPVYLTLFKAAALIESPS